MGSNHQISNLFHEFFSILAVEKENKLFICQKQVFFFSFGPIEILFYISSAKAEENSWKKLEKTRYMDCLVVWCHEQDKIRVYYVSFGIQVCYLDSTYIL